MLDEFKTFLLRGNVVDLAVAVVIGVAFGAVITAFVEDLVTPLIAAVGGQPDFSALDFTINDSRFLYGDFINKVLNFLIVSAVIFFFVVVPVNELMKRQKGVPAEPTSKECPFCISEVPIAATRCAYCTAELARA